MSLENKVEVAEVELTLHLEKDGTLELKGAVSTDLG
jgi:hypothetical protein